MAPPLVRPCHSCGIYCHATGLCTTACEDKYKDCPNWALGKANVFGTKSGKGCKDDKEFMEANCPHSCGICPRLHVFPPPVKDEF